MPHPDLFAVGLLLGTIVAVVAWAAASRAPSALVFLLPAAGLAAWLAAPRIDDAVDAWDRPAFLVVAIVLVGLGVAAGAGSSAAAPLGSVGLAWSMLGVVGATALAVPDTEGPVLLLGALAVPVLVLSWRGLVPEWAAAVTAVAVAAVATGGATLGPGAAVGSYGCIAVLLAAAPLNRHAPDGPAGTGVIAPWIAAPVITVVAVGVARLGAVRSTSVRALLVAAAGVVVAALVLEVAVAVTRRRAHPGR